jgi:hypothetical protein
MGLFIQIGIDPQTLHYDCLLASLWRTACIIGARTRYRSLTVDQLQIQAKGPDLKGPAKLRRSKTFFLGGNVGAEEPRQRVIGSALDEYLQSVSDALDQL